MAKLTLNDLKSQGLELTKDEGQELAPLIREVSHTGDFSANTVYEGVDNETVDAWFKGGAQASDETGTSEVENLSNTSETAQNEGAQTEVSSTTSESNTDNTEEATEAKAEHWKTKAKRLKEAGLTE